LIEKNITNHQKKRYNIHKTNRSVITMARKINGGIYPTMITPYKRSGEIDFDNVGKEVIV